MGYSKHIRAVKRVQPILDQLLEATSNVEWESDNPVADAYAMREGIYAASIRQLTPDGEPNEPFYSYARLSAKYVFRTAANKVIAELRDVVPIVALQRAHSTMIIREVEDEMGVVGAAILHKAPRMYFPDASPETTDLIAVHQWACQNEYHIVVSDEGITLTKENPGELAWTPSSS